MKMILIFMSITEKKIQVDENGCDYVLFRIDIYFTEYFWQQKLMKKVIPKETLFLKKKYKKRQEKNLTLNLLELILADKIRMQTMKLVEYKRLLVSLKIKKKKMK